MDLSNLKGIDDAEISEESVSSVPEPNCENLNPESTDKEQASSSGTARSQESRQNQEIANLRPMNFGLFLMVFGINAIAKKIIGRLDRKSLHQCERAHPLLSPNAEEALVWRDHLYFENFWCHQVKKSLDECSALLKSDPHSVFTFVNDRARFHQHLDNPDLQNFLNRFGRTIRELCLNFNENATWYSHHTPNALPEANAIQLIKNLISIQALRLKYISINIFCKLSWKTPHGSKSRPLTKGDTEFTDIHLDAATSIPNTHLIILKIFGNMSGKIMESIILCAPNLKEIILNEQHYRYLLDPLNRLKYLKSMVISSSEIITLEQMKNLNDGRLKLKRLTFELWEKQPGGVVRYEVLENRLIAVLNNVFRTSLISLEYFDFNGVALLEQITWPNYFPNLRKLKIGNPLERRNINGPLFSPNFNLALVFPHLEHFVLYNTLPENLQVNLYLFFDCLNFHPVHTVKIVNLKSWAQGSDTVRRVKVFFPNAVKILFRPG